MHARRLAVIAFLLLTSPAHAQTSDPGLLRRTPSQAPNLSVTTQLVVVNVAIHDKRTGAAIRKLSPAAFTVLDDNSPQTVVAVEEHSAAQPADRIPLPALPPNIFSNISSVRPADALNVIVIDTQHIGIFDQAHLSGQLHAFAQTLPPGARVAVVKNGIRLQLLCPFTADTARIEACLRTLPALPSTPIPSADIYAQHRVFAALTEWLGQFPGRKNVLWISSSLPDADPEGILLDSLEEFAENTLPTQRLSANEIAIYPIDPVGGGGARPPAGFSAATGGAFDVNAGMRANQQDASRTTAMDVVAHESGGRVFRGGNDVAAHMTQAVLDGANYYTIAYKPTNYRYGRVHHLEISVRAPHATVTYRPSYTARPAIGPAAFARANAAYHLLPAALSHGAPDDTGILFRARVQPTPVQPDLSDPHIRLGNYAAQLKNPIRFSVDWAADLRAIATVSFTGDSLIHAPAVLTAVIYNTRGELLNYIADDTSVTATAADFAAMKQHAGLQFHQFIDVPPGDCFFRLYITDTAGHTGSAEFAIHAAPPTPAHHVASAPAHDAP